MPAVARAVKQNPTLLGPILMSLFTRRGRGIAEKSQALSMETWYTLARLPLADHILSKTDAKWPLSKDITVCIDWPSTLRWGLDFYVYITYLIRSQRYVAAALAARMFLERWTLNLAHHHRVEPAEGESDAEFITRAWSVYPSIAGEHDMGLYWRWLSEYLHGRAELDIAWTQHRRHGDPEADYQTIGDRIDVVARTALIQVFGAIRVYAADHNLEKLTATLLKDPAEPRTDATWDEGEQVTASAHHMDFRFVSSDAASDLSREGGRYREFVKGAAAASLFQKSIALEYARMAYLERRGRAVDAARESFRHEIDIYGDEFNPDSLHTRLFRYIGIGEMARLCGATEPSAPEFRALETAAWALEAAWFVWLEDSDLSLGCVRVLIEQTARARAYRLKPVRAQGLEQLTGGAAPIRWLEAAGFKRLGSYNQALGQFSHIQRSLRIQGARGLLEKLQSSPGEHSAYTARGDALDEAAYLLAHELLARLDQDNADIAAQFRATVTLREASEHEVRLVDMLERSLDERDSDLGPSAFAIQPHADSLEHPQAPE